MKKTLYLLLSAILLTIAVSCERTDDLEIIDTATINVSVFGALSGNPRDAVNVVLYASENDATSEENAIISGRTNEEGLVIFEGLALDTTYWARANTILGLNKTIRSITTDDIENELDLPVL